MAQSAVRPLGVRSKAVKLNNLALIRFLGSPDVNVLPFLGSFLPEMDRQSDELASKIRYLWQDTLEELAEKDEITTETLLRAWPLIATPNKPTPPVGLLPKQVEPQKVAAPFDPVSVAIMTDAHVMDDIDTDTLTPAEARKTSDDPVPEDLDIEHDTFGTFGSVFAKWPYVMTSEHKLYGLLLVVGQLSGKNKQGHLVYKGCKLDDDSFSKIASIAEYEQKGQRDSTYKIRVLKLKTDHVLKFWVNVDDPSRPKGKRDLDEMYRYFRITPDGIREVDSLEYQALKNSLITP